MKLSAPIFRLKRQAKRLSRETGTPLHAALDQVAKQEGFRSWSHLAGAIEDDPASKLFAQLASGDLALLGARPGQGKTLLGLQLVIKAAQTRRPVFYFSLEETDKMISDRLSDLGFDSHLARDVLEVDTSDRICADYVIQRVQQCSVQSLVVIDYLQLLDQRRENPPLARQLETLSAFTRSAPSTVVTLSQIDRSYESDRKTLPDIADVRLPNQVDLSLFTRACFLHNGQLQIDTVR